MTDAAPYFADIARNTSGICHWLIAVDGVRLRVAHWPVEQAKGTVLIFPGRTEFIEKYGQSVAEFASRGYACAAIDWRGQGLADRLLKDPSIGHVDHFHDYQLDVKAMLAHVRKMGLPEPYHLLGHSMGGCIGLRALYDGLSVQSVVFSAPMWGIKMSGAIRPIAWSLGSMSKRFGFSGTFAPGQQGESYVLRVSAEENALTSDPDSFKAMQEQLHAHPELGLGGASLHWLHEALRETRALASRPAPDLPCVTFLGTDETIVDTDRVKNRMATWSKGNLVLLERARHEVLMETPALRARVFDGAEALFTASGRSNGLNQSA